MSIQQKDVLNFARPKTDPSSSARALHQAAGHLAGQNLGRPRMKTKDIVGYLLGHGARAWRGSLPVATPRVKVMMPNGHFAVKIKLG
jgi:hypothetical protein